MAALRLVAVPDGTRLRCACPVHGGDNPTAFSADPAAGRWHCWTRHCQDEFWGDAIGLARGVLTRLHGKEVSRREAADWVEKYGGGVRLVDATAARPVEWVAAALAGRDTTAATGPPLAAVRRRLTVPSPYFVARGFDAEVLSNFCVGEPVAAVDRRHRLWNRAIVPVVSADGTVAGYTCRYMGDHKADDVVKWYHDGFLSGHHLYGLGEAEPGIQETGTVVLVEGPADVWALRTLGVRNAVAMFGTKLADGQQVLLESLPVHTLVCAQDADEAGDDGAERTRASVRHLFKVERRRPPLHDWGDCRADDGPTVRKLLGG